ncbi:hypothetical protein AMTRI_Chr07g75990 [Amborella trichopoda]
MLHPQLSLSLSYSHGYILHSTKFLLHLCVWHRANAAAYFVLLHNERMCTHNDNDMTPCRVAREFSSRLVAFHSFFFSNVEFLFAFVRVEDCTRCTPYYTIQVRRTTKFC